VKSKRPARSDSAIVSTLPHGRDEMNLAEFPITLLADRAPGGVKTLVFEDAQGRLTVTGSDAYGLPTAADADVLIGLIQITKLRNNFAEPTVNFTRYELLRLLDWANEGKNYRRIDESLSRWVGVSLHYDRCWWDNRSKKYGDAKMHILDGVVILDGTTQETEGGTQQVLPLSSFTWNKTFLESCQADNLKRLDLETYFSLRSAISKRMYRFLDKRFYHRGRVVFDLREFALERVGLSRNYIGNAGKIKEKLQPALEELEAIGFLEPLAKDARFQKDGRNWTIRLEQGKKATLSGVPTLPSPAISGRSAPPDDPPLVAQLVARNVTRSKAVELVNQHPAAAIAAKLEIFDWLTQKKDRRLARSPAGWLVKAIEDDYAPPKGFESRADREREARDSQQRRRQADEERRRRSEADARARTEDEAVDRYWAALTPPQQTELDKAARALADPETLAQETGPLKRLGTAIRRRAYIRRLLHESGAMAPDQE
jgi:hypothetical protein